MGALAEIVVKILKVMMIVDRGGLLFIAMTITLRPLTTLNATGWFFILAQGCRLSATLRLVDSGHILAEQRQVSARWRRGHE